MMPFNRRAWTVDLDNDPFIYQYLQAIKAIMILFLKKQEQQNLHVLLKVVVSKELLFVVHFKVIAIMSR